MPNILWLLALGGVLLLTGCSTVYEDRENPEPDEMRDATRVVVWRNADRVPNLALFCADGRAWAATLNGLEGHRGQLLRDAERDDRCAG